MENEYLNALIWAKENLMQLENLKKIDSVKIDLILERLSQLLDLDIESVEEINDNLPF